MEPSQNRFSEVQLRTDSKTLARHVRGALASPSELIRDFGGAAGLFWFGTEIVERYARVEFGGIGHFLIGGFTCLIVALVAAARRYLSGSPREFAAESRRVRRLLQLQPQGWPYALAAELLDDRVRAAIDELDDTVAGRVFCTPRRFRSVQEYAGWAINLTRQWQELVAVAEQLLVVDLASACASHLDPIRRAERIRRVVERIADVVWRAVEIEKECRGAVPPSPFEHMGELQRGWSRVILSATEQTPAVFRRASRLRHDDESRSEFTIVFETPTNLDIFAREVERMADQLETR